MFDLSAVFLAWLALAAGAFALGPNMFAVVARALGSGRRSAVLASCHQLVSL